jgi:hypothetical protein
MKAVFATTKLSPPTPKTNLPRKMSSQDFLKIPTLIIICPTRVKDENNTRHFLTPNLHQ